MICEGVDWVKRCNQCTSICYGVPLDENGLCPGGNKECYHQPPRCERVCDEKSCNFVPIPLCNEVRVAKNVSLNYYYYFFFGLSMKFQTISLADKVFFVTHVSYGLIYEC